MNGKYIETKYTCKFCGNNDLSPNHDGDYIKGWRCNVCGKIVYPIKDKLKNKMNSHNNI